MVGEKVLVLPHEVGRHGIFDVETFDATVAKIPGILALLEVRCAPTRISPSPTNIVNSVIADISLQRPVFHILLNSDFEFEVYTNRDHSLQLFKPVQSESESHRGLRLVQASAR